MDDSIKLVSAKYYTETKEIPVMNVYGKPLAMPHILEDGCYEGCCTCKHYRDGKCVNYVAGREWVTPISDFHFYEFVCDFYRRRNSGAFRRKLKRYKNKLKEMRANK